MAHDVFISYSSKDKTIADAVCAGMEKEGIRCWIAPRDILPSENYDDAIIRALNSARVMVVIFSSRIFTSQFVKSEVERGFSKGLTIAPFRIENVDPEGGLELYLGRRHSRHRQILPVPSPTLGYGSKFWICPVKLTA